MILYHSKTLCPSRLPRDASIHITIFPISIVFLLHLHYCFTLDSRVTASLLPISICFTVGIITVERRHDSHDLLYGTFKIDFTARRALSTSKALEVHDNHKTSIYQQGSAPKHSQNRPTTPFESIGRFRTPQDFYLSISSRRPP